MIAADGAVKLADFGLARQRSMGANDASVMDSVVGTVLYQCPEIIQHEQYGEKADVGEVYRGFTNPYGRAPYLQYEWTQINEKILEQAWSLLPNGGKSAKLFVEVGSFVGRSSVLIGEWLRKREARTANDPAFDFMYGEDVG